MTTAVLERVAGPDSDATGTASPVRKIETMHFDDLGYPGWWMRVLTNPTAAAYDEIIESEDNSLWDKFARVVVEWNFPDNETGAPLGKPTGEALMLQIPWDIRRVLIRRYFDMFRERFDAPKDSSDNSTSISTTEP